jgi:hypothetical protein
MYGMTPVGIFFIAILPPVINDQAFCQQPQFETYYKQLSLNVGLFKFIKI